MPDKPNVRLCPGSGSYMLEAEPEVFVANGVVACPWCGKHLKLTPQGYLRKHQRVEVEEAVDWGHRW